MTAHTTGSRSGRGRLELALLAEVIDYLWRPRVKELGGDVWLDDVLADRMVVGFRRAGAGDDTVRSWLARQLELLGSRAEGAVELREREIGAF